MTDCAHDYENWMDFDVRERRCKKCSLVDREITPTYGVEDFSEAAQATFIIAEQAFLDIDDIPDTPDRALALLNFKNAALWIMQMARIEREKKNPNP
jgi:hypothetical protein